MTEGAREFSNRRSLAGVDIIDSKYIIYEGTTTDKNGAVSASYMVTINSWDSDGGTLQTFTQNIYYCNNKRVTKAGYDIYVKNTDNYWTNTPTTRTGCWCRKDRKGNTCSEYVEITCNLKVTNPDFTKPWRDKSYDSDFYTYSIPGYDPCHWIDKNQIIDVTYNIKCFNSN